MSLKFVPPPVRTLNFPRYATYIPHLAEMKSHTNMSAVKNRINYQCHKREALPGQEGVPYYQRKYRSFYKEVFVLENVDGEWFVLYHVPEGTEEDDLPWKKDAWRHKEYTSWGRQFHEPTFRPENYVKERVSRPMDTEEYVKWRIQVELEKRGIVE